MYLAPEGDELEIASASGSFLASAMPIARLHSPGSADMGPNLRRHLGEMGWFALIVPEDRGGSGLSSVEHVLFFREVGRQCGPVDVLAQAIAAASTADAGRRAALTSGEIGAALLIADGERHRLVGLPSAEIGLIIGDDAASLVSLADARCEPRPSLDPANSIGLIAACPPAVERSAGDTPWRLGQLGVAAMLLGLGEAALDRIVEYATVRETFGRPIGAYQAVRHPCAEMAVRLEAARAQLWYAAAAWKEGRADAGAHVDAARHLASAAAMFCADTSIQLHGGIGVTEEHDCHLLLKHAMLLSRLFGTKRQLLSSLLHARLEH